MQLIPVHDRLLYTGYGARLRACPSLTLLHTELQTTPVLAIYGTDRWFITSFTTVCWDGYMAVSMALTSHVI